MPKLSNLQINEINLCMIKVKDLGQFPIQSAQILTSSG